jgi:hypothetical protein
VIQSFNVPDRETAPTPAINRVSRGTAAPRIPGPTLLLLLGALDAKIRNNMFEKAIARNGSSGRGKSEVDFPLGKGQAGGYESCLPD